MITPTISLRRRANGRGPLLGLVLAAAAVTVAVAGFRAMGPGVALGAFATMRSTSPVISSARLQRNDHELERGARWSSHLCHSELGEVGPSRRELLDTAVKTAALTVLPSMLAQDAADAAPSVGRTSPGLSIDVDDQGFRQYERPYGASASGGMRAISQGKGSFPPYKFKVPEGWIQKAVSVADPSGPETDTRFTSPEDGDLLVVLPPVFTFVDDEEIVDELTIEQIAPPLQLLPAFAPQALGIGIEEDGDDVLDYSIVKKNGLTYYNYEVRPHSLVTATAYKGRVYVLSVKSTLSQWNRAKDKLRKIAESFEIVQSSA